MDTDNNSTAYTEAMLNSKIIVHDPIILFFDEAGNGTAYPHNLQGMVFRPRGAPLRPHAEPNYLVAYLTVVLRHEGEIFSESMTIREAIDSYRPGVDAINRIREQLSSAIDELRSIVITRAKRWIDDERIRKNENVKRRYGL